MSKRITVDTQMTNNDAVVRALEKMGVAYQVHGKSFTFTQGAIPRGSLDTQTGVLTTDDMWGKAEQFNPLRQSYSEIVCLDDYQKEGVVVDERIVEHNGDIVLMWHNA